MILPQILLVGAVLAVGVLHTMVPDHWLPIALVARQRNWSRAQTRAAAFKAGIGHVLSTLAIGTLVWLGGLALAVRYGHLVDSLSSIALVLFGVWLAISAVMEIYHEHRHAPHEKGHSHRHDHDHHDHGHRMDRTALLLIVGSSPMVEGIPAFFAASKYGIGLLTIMATVFSVSTIATYVILCTYSSVRLQNTSLGVFECYGEVLSGALIALVGLAFWFFPVL